MMKRRKFLKAAGAASVVLSAGSLMAFNRFPAMEDKKFTSEELKAALERYIDEVLNGKNFNPSELPPNGKLMIPRSYSIEIIDQKNTIFDIADLVIERLKKSGFDANSLKDGEMPDGLGVRNGIVDIPGQMFPIKIDELKNYDATIQLHNTLSLATTILPKDWIKLTEFEKEEYPNGLIIFKNKIGNNNFHLSVRKNYEKITQYRINVDELDPVIKITDFLPNMVSFDFFSKFFSEEQSKQFNI